MNTFAENACLRVYHNGPWFTFFVDALLLAPVATLVFLALSGWYLARRPPAEPEWLLLVFIGGSVGVFACLPYNPRYSSPVDVLMRVFVVTLAMSYYGARDFAATIAMSERAIAIDAGSAEAYNNLGAAYCEMGPWQDAIAPLETALRLNPAFTLARNNLAWARANVGPSGDVKR
jgi:tetratricopeptide (TPR) repeat protein